MVTDEELVVNRMKRRLAKLSGVQTMCLEARTPCVYICIYIYVYILAISLTCFPSYSPPFPFAFFVCDQSFDSFLSLSFLGLILPSTPST